MYPTPAKRSHVYEWKRLLKPTEKLKGTGANIEWMLNESKTEVDCPLNGTDMTHTVHCIIYM